jgi:hypothetical protein
LPLAVVSFVPPSVQVCKLRVVVSSVVSALLNLRYDVMVPNGKRIDT